MKIMRPDSRRRDYLRAGAGTTMAAPTNRKENVMKWQTPQAQDFRFGFEITMYIAAR